MSSSQGSSAAQGTTALRSESVEPSAAGYITPRVSWPRPTTPPDPVLVPNWAGEFRDFQDWVSFATNRLTGTYDPMMGNEVGAVCIDAFGRRCTAGGHFRRAKEEGAFPVRFFWDMRPAQQATTPASAEGTEAAQVEREDSRDDQKTPTDDGKGER
jgi:hypothetical protein